HHPVIVAELWQVATRLVGDRESVRLALDPGEKGAPFVPFVRDAAPLRRAGDAGLEHRLEMRRIDDGPLRPDPSRVSEPLVEGRAEGIERGDGLPVLAHELEGVAHQRANHTAASASWKGCHATDPARREDL